MGVGANVALHVCIFHLFATNIDVEFVGCWLIELCLTPCGATM